jgi:glycosyltransferase involved in cell wall biosynthesis
MYELSIIIPTRYSSGFIYETLTRVHEQVYAQVESLQYVLVNDGGDAATTESMQKFKSTYPDVLILELETYHGQQAAVQAGLKHAGGKYLLTYDDDLQYRPEDIQVLFDAIRLDNDALIYCGYPITRQQSGTYVFFSKLVVLIFDQIFFRSYRRSRFYTSFKVYRRELLFNGEHWLNKNVYFFWDFDPASIRHILVAHFPRKVGVSGYTLRKYLFFFRHIICMMLIKSINVIIAAGIVLTLFGVIGVYPGFIAITIAVMIRIALHNKLKSFRQLAYTVLRIIT